jgi:hypothetical protein
MFRISTDIDSHSSGVLCNAMNKTPRCAALASFRYVQLETYPLSGAQ